MTLARMSADQLAFLLDVANAPAPGLALTPSSDGVVSMPSGVIELIYLRGWLATLTPLGADLVASVRRKDRGAA